MHSFKVCIVLVINFFIANRNEYPPLGKDQPAASDSDKKYAKEILLSNSNWTL